MGGSSKSETKVPQYLEDAGRENIARANQVASIGYIPYSGPDVAALTPLQMASMQNTQGAASAFGLGTGGDPMAGMPKAQTFANGMHGYSSLPLHQANVNQFRQSNPQGYNAMMQSMQAQPLMPKPASVQQPSGQGGGK